MKHRWLVNGLLALTVLVLAGIAILKPGKQDESGTKQLSTINIDTINTIRLGRSHLADIEFSKTENKWRMVRPLAARANPYNVEALLRIATGDTETTFSARDQSLEKFGLENARHRLKLDDHEIIVGAQHPLKNSRYVKFGNTIAVMPVYALRIIETTVTDFIDTRLLEEGTKLNRLKLEKMTLSLDQGKWLLSGEQKPGVSADQLNMFIEEWQQARALTVQKYSGRSPIQQIVLGLAGADYANKELRLAVLAYEPELVLYRKDEGLEYRFTSDVGKRLLKLPEPPPATTPPADHETSGTH